MFADKNKTFKIQDVGKLFHEVTLDDWLKCVHHVHVLQQGDFKKLRL